jgi:hypothetical protein
MTAYTREGQAEYTIAVSFKERHFMTFVLLVDRKAPAKNDVQSWLNSNGLVAWLANDVPHAIEELSDFTVRNRPDVIMIEVAFLADSFDALKSTFDSAAGEEDVTVIGLAGEKPSYGKALANDFDQLRMMMKAKSCV